MTFRYWPQFKSTSIALAVSTALVGCGGDDDTPTSAVPDTPTTSSAQTSVNKPPTLAMQAPARQSENSVVAISINAMDADNDKLDVRWMQKSGPSVLLKSSNAKLFFIAPDVKQEETIVFEVSINDGNNPVVKDEVSVVVYPVGAKPTVTVSANQQVEGGDNVELTGAARDDGTVVSLEWTQVKVDQEPQVNLTSGTLGKATFTAPEVGHNPPLDLTFKLSATDNEGFAAEELKLVKVLPLAPEIKATQSAQLGAHKGGTLVEMPITVTSYADPATLSYHWEQVGSGPSATLSGAETDQASIEVPYSSEDIDVTIKVAVTDAFNRASATEFTLTVLATERPPFKGDLVLNDTGVTLCANQTLGDDGYNLPGLGWNGENSSQRDCALEKDANGFPIPMGQDGHLGRDEQAGQGTLNKVGAGRAGFDFTKLDNQGMPLDATATEWDCVQDNHTGLIWQVKAGKTDLHDKANTYTWYNPDQLRNGGNAGTQNGGTCTGSDCDTLAYVKATNELGYCGINTWSLPSYYQLLSIVDFGAAKDSAMVDTGYFPDTMDGTYWSSQATPSQDNLNWYINNVVKVFHFFGGLKSQYKADVDNVRAGTNYIRLVAKPEQTAGGAQ